MTKPKISVALAVYNEEENLARCLESIKDLAWEIVIVDGGSKDKTVSIAKSFGAKVIVTDNPPIFHINKNKAIDKACGDWILQLDADEQVTPSLALEIDQVTSQRSDIAGYFIPRSNFFLSRFLTKGGQYPDYTLRLYKKGKGRLPAKDVHEQAEVDGKVGYLQNPLLHIRDTSFSKYLSGLDRYTNLISQQIKQADKHHRLLTALDYMLIKPVNWFFRTYFRHKGFVDGLPGLIFSFFSSLRFPIAYIKYLKNN